MVDTEGMEGMEGMEEDIARTRQKTTTTLKMTQTNTSIISMT
ncbi:hypothetical protein [Gracilimonas sediminicola]